MSATDDITPILATPDHAAPSTTTPSPEPSPSPLNPAVLAACQIARGDQAPDPDAEGVSIRATWRDANAKGNGTESYRRVLRAGFAVWEWLTSERLPRGCYLASERHAVVHGDAWPGDLIATFSRGILRGKSDGKAHLQGDCVRLFCGVSSDEKNILVTCAIKKRRDGIAVVLPNGMQMNVASPDW